MEIGYIQSFPTQYETNLRPTFLIYQTHQFNKTRLLFHMFQQQTNCD